jgi:hypothetical protein
VEGQLMKAKKSSRKSKSTGRGWSKDLTARGSNVQGGKTSGMNIETRVLTAMETLSSDSTKDLQDLK